MWTVHAIPRTKAGERRRDPILVAAADSRDEAKALLAGMLGSEWTFTDTGAIRTCTVDEFTISEPPDNRPDGEAQT